MTNCLKDLILEASTSNNINRLEKLSKHCSMTVRRAVARNTLTPSYILENLAKDVALNVRYMALENKNCRVYGTLSKEDLVRKCVVCDISEIDTLVKCNKCY